MRDQYPFVVIEERNFSVAVDLPADLGRRFDYLADFDYWEFGWGQALFNAICNTITETDKCVINHVLPEIEKHPQYQEFGIYSTESPAGYFEGLSYKFEQNPISGELSIDVKIHDGLHQIDYESLYILKVDDGKIIEFKNCISNVVLDGKTLTLESMVSDNTRHL